MLPGLQVKMISIFCLFYSFASQKELDGIREDKELISTYTNSWTFTVGGGGYSGPNFTQPKSEVQVKFHFGGNLRSNHLTFSTQVWSPSQISLFRGGGGGVILV